MSRLTSLARTILVSALFLTLALPSSAFAAAPPASSTRLEAITLASSDLQKGYIAGGFAPDVGVVSRSTDQGATWSSKLVPHWMHAVNTSSNGSTVMASNGQRAFDWVESSTDFGLTWTTERPRGGSITAGYGGLAQFGTRRVAVGSHNDFGLIQSSVGGGAWNENYLGPVYPPSGEDPAPVTDAYFSAIGVAPGGAVGWAVGNDSTTGVNKVRILKTVDSGASWAVAEGGFTASSPWVTCVTAASNTTAFIGRDSKYLIRTTDGGTTWTHMGLAIVNQVNVNAIDSTDANTVVVVGDSGRVTYSTNAAGAYTWTARNPAGVTAHLRGVQMIDADSWIVVGDNETILRTDDAGVSWTGSKALGKPTVTITSPASLFSIGPATIDVAGTSEDPSNPVVAGRSGIGVAEVKVALQRANGQYWNGTGWASTPTWHDATTTDGWDTWSASESIDSTASLGGGLVIWARSRDGMGQYSTNAAVTSGSYVKPATQIAPTHTSVVAGYAAKATVSGILRSGGVALSSKPVVLKKGSTVVGSTTTGGGGAFSFTFLPANTASLYTIHYAGDAAFLQSSATVKITPKANLARPVAPTAKRNRSFTTYAYLLPKHPSGAGGTRFYFYRYQRLSSGKYDYVYKKSAAASTINSTSYPTKSKVKVRVKLPAGKWRVRAKHLDSGHAETYSPYEYFRVK